MVEESGCQVEVVLTGNGRVVQHSQAAVRVGQWEQTRATLPARLPRQSRHGQGSPRPRAVQDLEEGVVEHLDRVTTTHLQEVVEAEVGV